MRILILCFFFSFCCGICAAHAQDEEVVIDTAAVTNEETDEEEVSKDTAVLLNRDALIPAVPRSINKQKLEQIKQDDRFWYVNAVHAKKKTAVRTPDGSGLRRFLEVIVWVLIGVLVLFVLYHLLQSDVFKGRKKPAAVIPENSFEEAHFEDTDFSAQLAQAVAAHDYRSATRIHFLQLLQVLHRRGIIEYKTDALNSDYRRQWQGNAMAQQLNELTRVYEFSWFGHFHPSPQQFQQWQQTFVQTIQKLQV